MPFLDLVYYMSIYLSLDLSIYLSIYLSTHLPIYLYIYLFVYLSTFIYIYTYIYIYVYVDIYIYIHIVIRLNASSVSCHFPLGSGQCNSISIVSSVCDSRIQRKFLRGDVYRVVSTPRCPQSVPMNP